MPQGNLFVTVRTADSAFPVLVSQVTVLSPDGQVLGEDRVSSENGSRSRIFSLEAPPREFSLSPGEDLPYSTYDVRIEADGFYTFFIRGVQIFSGETSQLPVEMIPRGQSEDEVVEYVIGPHALREVSRRRPEAPSGEERVLSSVFIPERITVHLGTPSSNASNVTVPFVDYIKNVASSEIYPTWPEKSLRANILCQISLTLNRIFTEWYPSRGYNFNITNSTSYDQYYVYGRNIYDSISVIVDEIFNEYIRRPGRIDPYFAEYCNGSTVTCAGLSQWGTVSLANDGLSVEEILQFYYGDVEIVETNDIRAIESSYPGFPLSVGSSGDAVRTIQQQLNRIRINYPSIPAINSVDGVFGAQTRRAVETFQQIFNLTPDGVVGKATWYRISYIYVAVKKLAELNSEGERPQYDDTSYPGLLRFGDTGSGVQALQLYLKTLAAFNPFLVDVNIDGRFGRQTENAVRAFQEYYGLFVDGVVGENTWNRLIQEYLRLTENGRLIPKAYPGVPQKLGSDGEDVLYIQMLLNRIRPVFVTVPSVVEDGIFGPQVRASVREFQRLFGLEVDGVVGRNTWNALNRTYGSIVSGCLDDGGTETGRTLRYGSSGSDVRVVQERLRNIHRAVAAVPSVSVDGQYGRRTENAVILFQRIFGLTPDGVVGNVTRTRLGTISQAVTAGCLPLSSTREITESSGIGDEREEYDLPIQGGNWPEWCPWANEKEWEKRGEPSLSFEDKLKGDEFWEAMPWEFSRVGESREEWGPPAVSYRPLHPGSVGRFVWLLKILLREKGYGDPLAFGEKDLYGASTAKAVEAFQRDMGLLPTGRVDPQTWEYLFQ